jgi:hypothetical protein
VGCYHPLKGWRERSSGGITFRREDGNGEKMEVGCGHCLGCRLAYSHMWAMRIVHESTLHELDGGNCFITLTYRDKADCDTYEQWENGLHVPDDWSLHKSHFQKFMKRLRKWVFDPNGLGRKPLYDDDGFLTNGVRFFAVGEYGRKCKHGIDLTRYDCPLCNTGRPHFHACIFNLSFQDLEAYQSDGGVMRYTSPTLEKLWGYGFVDVGELNYNSAAYCAKYILKKVRAVNSDHHYMTYDMNGEITFITPEFTMMSRGNASHKGKKCGIGAGWYEKYKDDVFPSDETPVPGFGVMKGVPRYYYNILKEENPEMYEETKRKRLKWMYENKEEFTGPRLDAKEKVKIAKLKLFDKSTL